MIKGHLAYKLPRHPWNRPNSLRGVNYVVDKFITVYTTLEFRNGKAHKSGRQTMYSDLQDTRRMMLLNKRKWKLYMLNVSLER